MEEEFDYLPHETCSDNFEPVAPTINEKAVLSTIYPLNGSTSTLYEQLGFGHIRGLSWVNYSTVTTFAKFFGLSGFIPLLIER